MRILIAPAKRMRRDIDYIEPSALPCFLQETKQLLAIMKKQSPKQLRHILGCNERIAEEAYQNYRQLNPEIRTSPALLSYDGIQYTYMAPHVFDEEQLAYVQQHLRILSGFYGVLRPLDGVVPYRLELNNPFCTDFCTSLYDFWGSKLYEEVSRNQQVILDLASEQYSQIIRKYVKAPMRYVTCRFMDQKDGRWVMKGVYVKMARGEMVRYLAEKQVKELSAIKQFDRLGYQYSEEYSTENEFVFIRTALYHK